MANQIFDTEYVGEKPTEGSKQESETKNFLNKQNQIFDTEYVGEKPTEGSKQESEIKSYGNSKPKRVVIKAKISGS